MKCPSCGKSLWFAKKICPFCKTNIEIPESNSGNGLKRFIAFLLTGLSLAFLMKLVAAMIIMVIPQMRPSHSLNMTLGLCIVAFSFWVAYSINYSSGDKQK